MTIAALAPDVATLGLSDNNHHTSVGKSQLTIGLFERFDSQTRREVPFSKAPKFLRAEARPVLSRSARGRSRTG